MGRNVFFGHIYEQEAVALTIKKWRKKKWGKGVNSGLYY
jgi:hypothetical protein